MITGTEVRMARAGLAMAARDLADAAGISPGELEQIEAGIAVEVASLEAVRRALEAAGAQFPDSDGGLLTVAVPRDAGAPDAGLRPEELNASNDG